MTESARARASLDDFAARALDWPAVREVLEAYALTSLGKRALAELGPRDDDGARGALGRVGELLALEGEAATPPFAGVTDPIGFVRDARRFKRTLGPDDLAALGAHLGACEVLFAWVEARAEFLPRCALALADPPDLRDLRAAIDGAIDARGNVLDTSSSRLASLRREIDDLDRAIGRTLKKLVQNPGLRRFLADGQGQIQRRGGRSVLAVRARHAGQVPGIVHDRSQTEETLYVEPREIVEPANRLQGLRADESAEIARILAELTIAVLEREEDLVGSAGRVAELELAVLSARWAREAGARPASLPGERGAANELLLRAMRHPLLLEQARAGRIDAVVPIDLRLGGDFDMLVVTGPNTGGKTAAIKSAGLAGLLTRLGLPIPCDEGTTVPLYDGIAADIGDEQELQQNLSTFSSHLVRIAAGLRRATPRTLVLLDELGGGTDPDEGAALGDAILEELLERRVPTIATTHLGRLKEFAYRHVRAENACAEFDIETLRPLYRLLIGTPGESRALAIARRHGLEDDLVDRAAARLRRGEDEVRSLMEDVRRSRSAVEELRSEADERLAELERGRRDLDAQREQVAESRELLDTEAEQDLAARIRGVRPHIERLEGLLSQLPPGPRGEVGREVASLRGALDGAMLSQGRAAFLENLRKGEFVFVPKLKRRVLVHKVDRTRGRVVVKLGNQRVTFDFDDVSRFEAL